MATRRQILLALYLGNLISVSAAWGAVIVDNDDGSPAYVEAGTWFTSGSTGYNGGTYRWTNSGDQATATWTGNLTNAGQYEVFVWYTPGTNRTASTSYDIFATDQTHTVYIDQSTGGLGWESLGTFSFNAGDNFITLDAANSTGGTVVVADAVRFGVESGCLVTPPTAVEIAPGVWHSEWSLPAPQVLQVLEFDLADRRYTVEMGFAKGQRNYSAREVTSQIAGRYDTPTYDVIGAINASHFDSGLFIHGMQGARGNVVSYPTLSWPREAYVLQESGEPFVATDTPAADPTVRFADDAEMRVDVLNYTCTSNTLAIYTPEWDTTTGSTVEGVEVIVENVSYPLRPNKWISGVITAVRTGPNSVNNAIPSDGFVLAACPGAEAELLSHVTVGDEISARIELQPLDLNNAKVICGGASGWLVKDGAPFPENWDYSHAPVRHPRTVVAWSGTRHWFVTCDGRQTGYSVGMTYTEMADFLVDCLQVEHAINLDGGGSTTMIVNGSVVNCPSDGAATPCTGSERAVPNVLLLVDRDDTTDSALSDPFSLEGRALDWDDKFSFNPVVPFAPTAPDGDGYVLELFNPDGEYETSSLGGSADADVTVRASLYCEYRPGVAADGFERVGVFARDDGNANFDASELGGGNCYALTHDTDTGRIRAGVVVDGVFLDFLDASPLYEPSTAWREFRILCARRRIRYLVDDAIVADVDDSTHVSGRFGLGYHEYFGNDGNMHGAHVDNFGGVVVDFDADGDGDVDTYDFYMFLFCMLGPDAAYNSGQTCASEDGDGDFDVDVADFAVFQRYYTGE